MKLDEPEWFDGNPIDFLNRVVCAHGTTKQQSQKWLRYFDPIPELSYGLPVPILGIMVLIWQLRDRDLQIFFPLKTRQSRLDFIAWCIVHGWREYQALREANQLWEALNQPASFPGKLLADDPGNAISLKMLLGVRQRQDLNFDTTTKAGRTGLLTWYILHGKHEFGFGDERFTSWQIRYFFSSSAIPKLNCLQALIHHARPDIAQQFPLPVAVRDYIDWFRRFITIETNLIDALRSTAVNANPSPILMTPLPMGVNVIGYAYGQLGIGEDARMAVKSLLSTDLPVTLLDFSPGKGTAQADHSMAEHVGKEPIYAVNVFCLSALEHARCFAERGRELFADRINVGYWPWELSHWPQEWNHLLALVDEVWVSSPHTMQALQPVSATPVRLMPMAVEVGPIAHRTRATFGLPEKAFLFLFAFDLNSFAKRKNPKACVLAFLNAFPRGVDFGADRVGLAIKVHPPSTSNREWDELKELQLRDTRIHLIEETLNRPDLLALYSACDCFVSLHRAEGFGRSIAEAMLLGKPVIATGYSGNMAFNNEENALLVKYNISELVEGDYPYGNGQCWAEPSIQDAAQQMRRVFEKSAIIKILAGNGKKTINSKHHPSVVGQQYADVIKTWTS